MANTPEFDLPLLAAAQAQKHVTVNEALSRLDALVHPRITLPALTTPPATANEGECYQVAAGATGAWAGQDGMLAVWLNGGWSFSTPKQGWRGFDQVQGAPVLFDGTAWIADAVAASAGGAATIQRVIETDHSLAAGASSATAALIPANAQVIGVTARVIADITGSATGWSLGVAGATNRYGSGLGLAKNSWAQGLSGAPVTYYADTSLILTAEGGTFAGGAVRLAVHLTELVIPRSV
ncbi:MAG: DUF2793 domain-containing protein [Alphaproteobacteria bacterium]|nr:MAG: DUF2793 domain-containing protein [Alphaproteobacteria bacterium]